MADNSTDAPSGVSLLFVDPSTLPSNGYGFIQLLFLICVYGFILFRASKLIADGSELLMLVLNPGVVGGLLLPVLGAVPDGAIVLFSGLGPNAQTQLSVGVGTLAGSTIMLLTLPWAACIALGRVDLSATTGIALYQQKPKLSHTHTLTAGASWTRTGVAPTPEVPMNAKLMMLTALTYFVIQGPAWANDVGSVGHACALAAFVLSSFAFLAYSGYQVWSANALEQQKARIVAARRHALEREWLNIAQVLELEQSTGSTLSGVATGPAVLRRVFDRFDTDGSGEIDKAELKLMLRDLGYKVDNDQLKAIMHEIGGSDMKIQFEEFCSAVHRQHLDRQKGGASSTSTGPSSPRRADGVLRKDPRDLPAGALMADIEGVASVNGESPRKPKRIASFVPGPVPGQSEVKIVEVEEAEEEEEEDEEEEELAMTPFQIKFKALTILAIGVGLVTLFSDPMVDALTELGNRISVPPFYVSFLITPVVSNASEIISSIIFAGRKTSASITLTFSALLGAATMNNTFCLSIFLALVYFQNLTWQYSAEVTAILAVELVMAVLSMSKVSPLWHMSIPLSLYPLSLLLVWVLENKAGWQ